MYLGEFLVLKICGKNTYHEYAIDLYLVQKARNVFINIILCIA